MVARELAVAREGHNLNAVRRHLASAQNPVNATSVFLNGFEPIEGPDALVHALARGRPCVGEEPVVGQDCVSLVGTGGGVEIAHEQHGQLGVEGGEAFTDELGALLAGFLDLMIKMGVKEDELAFGLTIPELHPRHHAGKLRPPVFRADKLRRIRQPEVIERERFQPRRAVKHRHELAPAAAVSPEADPLECWQVRGEVLKLTVKALLRAEDIGGELFDEFTHNRAALRPGVRRVGTGELQVISHHRQGARRDGGCSLCCGAELQEDGVASDEDQDVGDTTNECTLSHDADSSKSRAAGKSFAQGGFKKS